MYIRNLFKNINAKEWQLIIIMIFLVIVITSIPHIYGFLNTPDGFVYFGRQSLNSADTPVYFSYLEQVNQGHWFFKDLFTSEYQAERFFDPFWLAVGLFGKVFSLSAASAFQIVRILLIPLLIIVSYLFISFFINEKEKRKICFILLLFSSGLGVLFSGWLAPLYRSSYGYANWPMDSWVPESSTFFIFYHTPHLIASMILILLVLLFILIAFESDRKFYSILAGLFALVLFQFHPYHVPTIFGILGVYLITLCIKYKKIRWDMIKHLTILSLISLPSITYYFLRLQYDWLAWQKAVQNICLTPSFLMVIISYGLLFVFALFGIISILKKNNDRLIFLIVWPITQFLIMYLPVSFQRRFTEGLHVAMTLLASLGIFFIYEAFLKEKLKFRLIFVNKFLIFIFFIIFFCFSNIYILTRDIGYVYARSEVFYISKYKLESIEWLAKNSRENEIIFSSWSNGNIIPAFSARTVYVGHGAETAYPFVKMEEAKWFFRDNKNIGEKYLFLKKNKITYLFFGPEERALGFNPENADYLKKVYQNSEVAIYKVMD